MAYLLGRVANMYLDGGVCPNRSVEADGYRSVTG